MTLLNDLFVKCILLNVLFTITLNKNTNFSNRIKKLDIYDSVENIKHISKVDHAVSNSHIQDCKESNHAFPFANNTFSHSEVEVVKDALHPSLALNRDTVVTTRADDANFKIQSNDFNDKHLVSAATENNDRQKNNNRHSVQQEEQQPKHYQQLEKQLHQQHQQPQKPQQQQTQQEDLQKTNKQDVNRSSSKGHQTVDSNEWHQLESPSIESLHLHESNQLPSFTGSNGSPEAPLSETNTKATKKSVENNTNVLPRSDAVSKNVPVVAEISSVNDGSSASDGILYLPFNSSFTKSHVFPSLKQISLLTPATTKNKTLRYNVNYVSLDDVTSLETEGESQSTMTASTLKDSMLQLSINSIQHSKESLQTRVGDSNGFKLSIKEERSVSPRDDGVEYFIEDWHKNLEKPLFVDHGSRVENKVKFQPKYYNSFEKYGSGDLNYILDMPESHDDIKPNLEKELTEASIEEGQSHPPENFPWELVHERWEIIPEVLLSIKSGPNNSQIRPPHSKTFSLLKNFPHFEANSQQSHVKRQPPKNIKNSDLSLPPSTNNQQISRSNRITKQSSVTFVKAKTGFLKNPKKPSGPPEGMQSDDASQYSGGVRKDLAALSRNISAVLESLLKDYNNKIRPGYRAGKLTTIKMNMLIRSMGPIAEKDMKYSMDCYLRQEWHDDRLTFQGPLKQLTLNIKMLEALWKPDTFFHNGLGSYVHTITRPNKLFRITQDGRILYSMRLTIKAKCPMELRNFPMDKQSCPLIISSYAYTEREVKYQWDSKLVTFEPGMALSQFDLLNSKCMNYSAGWRTGQGNYSVLQVNFNLQRHTGYFLIQVYVPCFLIVVLSWVSFWLNREATSDRVGLGITTVLTLSTISLDSRTDLPKVHYATALDWFILMSFGYCMATLLQCAGVHYFTKVGSGDGQSDDEWLDIDGTEHTPPPRVFRRSLRRPCTVSSYSIDECSTSLLGLSSVLLLDPKSSGAWTQLQHHHQQQQQHQANQRQQYWQQQQRQLQEFPNSSGARQGFQQGSYAENQQFIQHGNVENQTDMYHNVEPTSYQNFQQNSNQQSDSLVASQNLIQDITTETPQNIIQEMPNCMAQDTSPESTRESAQGMPTQCGPPGITIQSAPQRLTSQGVFQSMPMPCLPSGLATQVFSQGITPQGSPRRTAIQGISREVSQQEIPSLDTESFIPVSAHALRRNNSTGGQYGCGELGWTEESGRGIGRDASLDTETGLASTVSYSAWRKQPGDSTYFCHQQQHHCHPSGFERCGSDITLRNTEVTLRNAETQTSQKESFWYQFARCIIGSESYRRQRERQATIQGSVNSVSRIDKLSRVLFPVSYGLLNLWYWYSYYDTELAFNWNEPGFESFA